jgi:uncharacterized Zn finger protein (UPF0148 family)
MLRCCEKCGTPLHEYGDILFCPNCDSKPWELENKKDDKNGNPPSYV